MKTLQLALVFTFFTFTVFAQNATVATDKNLEDGEFDKYSTFTFADHINNDDNSYFWDSESLKSKIKEEVKGELEALGYEYTDGPDADLLVTFQILNEDTEFTGWVNNFSDDRYWGPMELSARTREPDDKKTYHLDKGTLLIHMADIDKGLAVWRGYASGIIDDSNITDDDENAIAEAVEKIFDEYNFSASAK